MSGSDILFLDTETTGLRVHHGDQVFGIAYALNSQQVEYVDTRTDNQDKIRSLIERVPTIVCHGTKFDAHALYTIGIDIVNKDLDCTLIREQLIDEHQFTYDLDSLTGMKMDIIADLAERFGGKATKNVQMKNLHAAPKDFVAKYAIQDVEAMRNLYMRQVNHLPPVHELEKKVLQCLIRMERQGVRVDMDKHQTAVAKVEELIFKAQKELNQLVGAEVNVNSTPQMRDLLVDKERVDGELTFKKRSGKYVLIDGTLADSTKNGGPTLNAETLQGMNHPTAELILKVRKYRKILDTFLISQLGHQVGGRVHPWYNQCRVVTGRLSCSDPNLQAVPKRDPEMKAILRPLFLPEEGMKMLKCDYEQSDVRGFAHYIATSSGDTNHPVLKAYQEDPYTDFHNFVADMMHIPRNPGPDGGANAKQINLAMIFNMGAGKLAKQMGMPYYEDRDSKSGKVYLKPGDEAQAIFDLYHARIPGAADMGKRAASVAASRGHVASIGGRYLRFPNRKLTYKASGYLYQAFTADLIKMAMVATIDLAICHMQIHDELVFSIDHEDQAWAIKEAMEGVLDGLTEIPVRTMPEVGKSWGETKKLEGRNG